MTSRLPETIEPIKLAERGVSLNGSLELAGMSRLQASLAKTRETVKVTLDFSRDLVGRPVLDGRLQTEVSMCCQRCMQDMPVTIDAGLHIALLHEGQDEEGVPDEYETLIVDESPMSLRDLVEDELILALPLVAMHETEDCHVSQPEEVEAAQDSRPNPFAVLAELKTRK